MPDPFSDHIHTSIWQETATAEQPFQAEQCRAAGYDVFGELIHKASQAEMLWLLLRGERPTPLEARAFNLLAVALANPGPRSPAVHAAMATGASGSTSAASLIAALASAAGGHGGAHEVFLVMEAWDAAPREAWHAALVARPMATRRSVWPDLEHTPGFEPHGRAVARPACQTLAALCTLLPQGRLAWLAAQRTTLESAAGSGLAMSGVAAAALLDLGFDAAAGEMLVLLLGLPGAAAHALEQRRQGFRQFPFFQLQLTDDPDAP